MIEARISALYSVLKGGGDFAGFMYDNRNVPVGMAFEEFTRLISPPPKPPQP
jgi:hypothetical protein